MAPVRCLPVLVLTVLTVLHVLHTAESFGPASGNFELCGNYCGPGYCDGKMIDEKNCDDSLGSRGCTDSCCKAHDTCCGHGSRQKCNGNIVKCLGACDPKDRCYVKDSWSSGDVVCAAILDYNYCTPSMISAGMNIVYDWCCGSPCSMDVAAGSIVARQMYMGQATLATLEAAQLKSLAAFMHHAYPWDYAIPQARKSTATGPPTGQTMVAELLATFDASTFAPGSAVLLEGRNSSRIMPRSPSVQRQL